MPGATANGFPYPLGTDLIADGDDAIKALAEYTDAKTICWAMAYKSASQSVTSGSTAWFTDLLTGKTAGGMVVAADGITVPVKGWYWMTGNSFLSPATANAGGNCVLGDGTAVWAYGGAIGSVTVLSVTAIAQVARLLNAGTKVRWGQTAANGNVTVNANGGDPNFQNLHVRLLMPIP